MTPTSLNKRDAGGHPGTRPPASLLFRRERLSPPSPEAPRRIISSRLAHPAHPTPVSKFFTQYAFKGAQWEQNSRRRLVPMPEPQVFTDGNMNQAVVRIGNKVHRAASPQTATIHRLLTHVRAHGVDWVPMPHGFDDQGREVLDYLPGEVVHVPTPALREAPVLAAVARALRQWHDATATFTRTPQDVWWQPEISPAEVICHVDFAPYNHVFDGSEFVGAIDFDLCTPGPRLWDVAYTAYRYVPLTPGRADAVPDGPAPDRCDMGHHKQRERLAAFVAAYGLSSVTAQAVLEILPARLDAMADWCAPQDSADLRQNGVMYRAHARWIEGGALSE